MANKNTKTNKTTGLNVNTNISVDIDDTVVPIVDDEDNTKDRQSRKPAKIYTVIGWLTLFTFIGSCISIWGLSWPYNDLDIALNTIPVLMNIGGCSILFFIIGYGYLIIGGLIAIGRNRVLSIASIFAYMSIPIALIVSIFFIGMDIFEEVIEWVDTGEFSIASFDDVIYSLSFPFYMVKNLFSGAETETVTYVSMSEYVYVEYNHRGRYSKGITGIKITSDWLVNFQTSNGEFLTLRNPYPKYLQETQTFNNTEISYYEFYKYDYYIPYGKQDYPNTSS